MLRRGQALLLSLAVAVGVTLLLALGFDDAFELPLRDALLVRLPQRPAAATAVVAIDEASLRELGAWPWPRARLAELVDRIAASGARAVILDLLLSDPRPDDDRLGVALHRLPAVAVSVLDEHHQWLVPSPPIGAAATAAHGNFELDRDGILRRLASTKQSPDRALTALSVEAATIASGAPVPVGVSLAPAFRTHPRRIPQVSAAALLRGQGSERLRGRLVFVGPTALALGDRVLTPVSEGTATDPDVALPDPGVTVHAAATESLIRHEIVRELPPLAAGLLAGVAVLLIVLRRSRRARLVTAFLLAAGALIAAVILLDVADVALPLGMLLLAVVLSTAALEAVLLVVASQRSASAAQRLEQNLGIAPREAAEVAPRLEEIGVRLAERRELEAESKRLLAHELRTPLASMRGLSQLLGGFELSDSERRRVASLLESEAGKLQAMVQALLDLERVPLRDFLASTAPVDLGALVAQRVGFLQASTDRRITMSITPELFVRADAALLERAVDNLVGNALKYATAPENADAIDVPVPDVRVSVERRGGEALLAVEDRGPGIAPGERERLFERFFRGRAAAATSGLGLGLSFVAEIARWHQGTLAHEAPEAGGARFLITLPLAIAPARAGAG